jgi:hypothetical protein
VAPFRQRRGALARRSGPRRRDGAAEVFLQGECARHAQCGEAVAAERRYFGIAGQQQAVVGQQGAQHGDGGDAGRLVEIDQQVAAEHHVVAAGRAAGVERQQVALGEGDLRAQRIADLVLVAVAAEVALAERQRAAAERVAAVAPGIGARDRRLRQIDALDAERGGGDGGVVQRHRHRVRLLAAGARHRQDVHHPLRARGQPALHEGGGGGEGVRVAEHP